MRKSLLLILLCLITQPLLRAQNQINYWFFGENAGLNFNTTPPTVLTGSGMKTFESCTAISDQDGNLLFYTNGGPFPGDNYTGAVWNRDKTIMVNGDLSTVNFCNSSGMGTIIVPDPAYNQGYYIFITDCIENGRVGGLRYHYVDMALANGKGAVVSKNTFLVSDVIESMIAIFDPSTCGYWLISHKAASDKYVLFHITSSGISAPIYQTVGSVVTQYAAQLSSSADGTRIAFAASTFGGGFLLDFNPSTGVISNEISIGMDATTCAFSASGRYVYFHPIGTYKIYQFDTQASSVVDSKVLVADMPQGTEYGVLVRGPDGKIYMPNRYSTISYFNNPDAAGLACNFVFEGITLLGTDKSNIGLPNFCNHYEFNCSPTSTQPSVVTGDSQSVTYSDGQLNIVSGTLGYSLSLYEQSGKVVFETEHGTAEQLALSSYSIKPGLYLYKIRYANGKSSSGKIMVP